MCGGRQALTETGAASANVPVEDVELLGVVVIDQRRLRSLERPLA